MMNFHPSVVALALRKTSQARGEWTMTEIWRTDQLIGAEFDRILWLRRPDQAMWSAGIAAIARTGGDFVRLWAGEAA